MGGESQRSARGGDDEGVRLNEDDGADRTATEDNNNHVIMVIIVTMADATGHGVEINAGRIAA